MVQKSGPCIYKLIVHSVHCTLPRFIRGPWTWLPLLFFVGSNLGSSDNDLSGGQGRKKICNDPGNQDVKGERVSTLGSFSIPGS
jgi:hypothetical protein